MQEALWRVCASVCGWEPASGGDSPEPAWLSKQRLQSAPLLAGAGLLCLPQLVAIMQHLQSQSYALPWPS